MTEQPMATAKPQGRVTRVWVLVVLVFGVMLGAILALTIPTTTIPLGPGGFFLLSIERALRLHVFLTTIEMVLLFSLVVVYLKIYSATRANFSLGLLIVLFALLVHSILSYPITVNQIGPVVLGSGAFFPYPDIFTIFAYAVFLYLSLE